MRTEKSGNKTRLNGEKMGSTAGVRKKQFTEKEKSVRQVLAQIKKKKKYR